MQHDYVQQRAARAAHARTRRRMKTLFKNAIKLSGESGMDVYLVVFRRGRFHEFNSDNKSQTLLPPIPSVTVRHIRASHLIGIR